jgi:hypothetical protein
LLENTDGIRILRCQRLTGVMTTSSEARKSHTMLPSRFSLGKRLGDYNLDMVKSRKAHG